MKNRILYTYILLSALMILFIFSDTSAQQSGNVKFRDRFFMGSYLNIVFGTYTDIEISPFAGYKITPRIWSGLGINYMLYGDYFTGSANYTSFYGANVFTKFTLLKDIPSRHTSIFAHIEFLELNMKHIFDNKRYFQEFYLIGGGLRQYLGGRTNIELLVLFETKEAEFTPYNSPIFRIGIIF